MIRAIDGFDHYGAASDLQKKAKGIVWTGVDGCSIQAPGTRGLGKCIKIAQTDPNGTPPLFTGALTADYGEGFFEFDVTVLLGSGSAGISDVSIRILEFGGGLTQARVDLSASGAVIRVYNSAGTQLASHAGAFVIGPAFKLGIGVKVDDTAGYVAVRVNNQAVLTASAIDTKGGSAATFNGLSITASRSNSGCLIDNFTFCDTVAGPGTYPTDTFLGMTRVNTLFPTGNGATIQWTPAAGANWQEVNAAAFNGGTTYNATATNGATDLLVLQSLTGTVSTVIAVQLTGAYEADAAGPLAAKHLISNGSTVAVGSAMAIGLDYAFLSDIAEVNPITSGAWTAAQVNSYTFGYENVAL
jgi:hypothetical protein